MEINKNLSLTGCWRMVNAIQNGSTGKEVRMRCEIAKSWLNANQVINNDEYDSLMETVAYLYRESYR